MTMTGTKTSTCFILCTLPALVCCFAAIPDDSSPTVPAAARQASADLAKRIVEVTSAVLEHHIDPPTRQQMILSGVKAVYRKASLPIPHGLSRRVSEIVTPAQLEAFLAGMYPRFTGGAIPAEALVESLFDGLLQSVPGDARMISAKERKVAEQFEGNRYVGLHIALTMDDQEKRPKLAEVFEGGPADRAGVKKDDIIEEIDGVDTKAMALRDAVDRLRGEKGTSVTIKVRQPKPHELRTFKINRDQLPRTTVRGVRKRSSGGWDVRLGGPDPIGYLQISEIMTSTPHELRVLARQLEDEGARALVLDLRGLNSDSLHPTALLADSLLDHGCIGRIGKAHGETIYQADSDALLRDWPLVVLIDGMTGGTAEWLAAALQDNHRAILVGTRSANTHSRHGAGVQSSISIGDGSWSIILTTGLLEHGDGRPLSTESARKTDGAAIGQSHDQAASKSGVNPDHTIGESALAGAMLARARSRRKDHEPVSDSDKPLQKAVELLRESLKRT
jgi:carboxyl-terminal processing protease